MGSERGCGGRGDTSWELAGPCVPAEKRGLELINNEVAKRETSISAANKHIEEHGPETEVTGRVIPLVMQRGAGWLPPAHPMHVAVGMRLWGQPW